MRSRYYNKALTINSGGTLTTANGNTCNIGASSGALTLQGGGHADRRHAGPELGLVDDQHFRLSGHRGRRQPRGGHDQRPDGFGRKQFESIDV